MSVGASTGYSATVIDLAPGGRRTAVSGSGAAAAYKMIRPGAQLALSAQDVADAVGTDNGKARKLLSRMAAIGDIERSTRGLYRWGAGDNGDKGTNDVGETDLLDLVA